MLRNRSVAIAVVLLSFVGCSSDKKAPADAGLANPPLFKLDTPNQSWRRFRCHMTCAGPRLVRRRRLYRCRCLGMGGGGRKGPPERGIRNRRRSSICFDHTQGSRPRPRVAFSPDGKWLAVGTCASVASVGDEAGELAIFDVPAFMPKFTAKSSGAKVGFVDITWSTDGNAFYAVEGSEPRDEAKSQVRRWAMPAFTEQPVIRAPKGKYSALAVSADGTTLAVAEDRGLVRLFDVAKGTERTSFPIEKTPGLGWRLAFSADGKAIGLFDQGRPFWFDTATDKPANPKTARVAIQPAGLSHPWCSRYAISPDFSRKIWGMNGTRHSSFRKHRRPTTVRSSTLRTTRPAKPGNGAWAIRETRLPSRCPRRYEIGGCGPDRPGR